jgi:hypothetical protein
VASVATAKTDTPPEAARTRTLESPGFGAYGAAATARLDLTSALDKTPDSKLNGSLDFTDSDKRWLKELGITTTDPNKFHKAWESGQEKYNSTHRTWANTYGGRLGMRTVSRGIVGAAFYAAGNMYAGKKMKGYKLEGEDPKNLLQHIARFIDNTAGEGMQWAVKAITHDENKALKSVMFRDTVNYGNKLMGRSLGHEAMSVTFDFASMSFGDYMTRYALGLVDPNAKKHWIKDGHIDVPGGLKDLLYNVFRGVTYAAGEDMAVALPYVYGMRLQRHLIEKSSPGFRYDSDRSLNGGSYKVENGKVVGDYQLEGMLDLMGRFSWYNVGTKMFRDAYGAVQTKVERFEDRWKKGDHSLPKISIDPQKLTLSGMAHGAAGGLRYIVRTTIKVMGYMIPATVFFFISRSPQSKTRGIAIDVEKNVETGLEKGVLMRREKYDNSTVPVRNGQSAENLDSVENSGYLGTGKAKHVTPDRTYKEDLRNAELHYLNDKGVETKTAINPFDTPLKRKDEAFRGTFYEKSPPHSFFDRFGQASFNYGTAVEKGANGIIQSLSRRFKPIAAAASKINTDEIEEFSRIYANAALAYTPYFMMKTDVLSAEWDTKRTDMALDRALDGIGHLKWGEFKAGMGEVLRAMMREPFTDPRREALAQKLRWGADSEHQSNEAYQLTGDNSREFYLENEDKKRPFANESLKPKKITPATFTQLKPKDASWATQEALRQFQDTNTQGQSVH